MLCNYSSMHKLLVGAIIEVMAWINDYTPYQTMNVITHPCLNLSWYMVRKEACGHCNGHKWILELRASNIFLYHIHQTILWPLWILIRQDLESLRPSDAYMHRQHKSSLYSPLNEVVGGYTGFTPSVQTSRRPSVCPSVRPASRVRSVVPTVLVGSISYSYILSSNFRRCVVCKVSCKISQNLYFWQFF